MFIGDRGGGQILVMNNDWTSRGYEILTINNYSGTSMECFYVNSEASEILSTQAKPTSKALGETLYSLWPFSYVPLYFSLLVNAENSDETYDACMV